MRNWKRFEVFGYGLMKDALNLMDMMEEEDVSKAELETFLSDQYHKIPSSNKPKTKTKAVDFTKMPVSKKYKIFKEKNPDSNMTIEEFIKELRAGKSPCKGCNDKKK